MSMQADAVQNGAQSQHDNHHGAVTLDLPLAAGNTLAVVDLDELVEALRFAGVAPELVVTYVDANGRRRYVERCPDRKQRRTV